MRNAWNGIGLFVLAAGALLLTASALAIAWNGWLSPMFRSGSDEGAALMAAFIGPLWLIGLPLSAIGAALWWFSKPSSLGGS